MNLRGYALPTLILAVALFLLAHYAPQPVGSIVTALAGIAGGMALYDLTRRR